MKGLPTYLERRRQACWAHGIEHREVLVARFMDEHGLSERPLLREIIDDLIEDVQGARLREAVLPLDRFAQTEVVDGRIEVTVNTRIGEMPGVRHVDGIVHVAKWHESLHVADDINPAEDERRRAQPFLPGLEAEAPPRIVCRWADARRRPLSAIEFAAETAALAAAVAAPDLVRCPAFRQLMRRAGRGGDLGSQGWSLLYRTAEFIGVNPPVLVRYFGQRGFCRVVEEGGRRRLVADPQMEGGLTWL